MMRLMFQALLCQFKFYRRKQGGKWYYICDIQAVSGFATSLDFWSANPPREDQLLLKEEVY